jgi:hypothetical protein
MQSGVFHYLGTNRNREAWTNPHKAGSVEVACSRQGGACVRACVRALVYAYVYVYIDIYICMCVYVYMCICVYVYMCICVYVYVNV